MRRQPKWLDMAGFMVGIHIKTLAIEPEMLNIIAELQEFKGAWRDCYFPDSTLVLLVSNASTESPKTNERGSNH